PYCCLSERSCSVFFFFFSSRRRHTSSLRDWSSDVCSSDLFTARVFGLSMRVPPKSKPPWLVCFVSSHWLLPPPTISKIEWAPVRSEERRVGKEWRCRWSPDL